MFLEIQERVRQRFVAVVHEVFGREIPAPALGFPPSVDLGELSIVSCFELAKPLRQAPRKIAEQVAAKLLPIKGVERVSIAGPGYLNLHLDRVGLAQSLFGSRSAAASALAAEGEKILVEHTSINPNKAAHIGHLRNAVLGDSFVRLLGFRRRRVEIQNYIDNTGVQVADVIVGFVHLERKTAEDVRRLIADPRERFDYYCWDLYARVFQWYQEEKESLAHRAEALKAIEEGRGDLAQMAEIVSSAIVATHLATMRRVNVEYDLLVQESEILRLDFWKSAFDLMKQTGALRFEDSGKNKGCWVMAMTAVEEASETAAEPVGESTEDAKIIVRSNGTVTYVGKDIAYHLWKFALLGKDFGYEPFYRYPDGHPVWRTTVEPSGEAAPAFGHAAAAYAVIDTRQSYVQSVVAAAFRALGYHREAANLHHFAYEVVGLSPRCAEEMGLALSDEDRQKGYVEVSGRKGLGIKADDLIDRLIAKATDEVRSRQMTEDPAKQAAYGRMIAVGALRYFLLKFTRRSIISFDFKEALAFEGETGPYLQYSVVRARNIFRKFSEANPGFEAAQLQEIPAVELARFFAGEEGKPFWELALLAAELEMVAEQAIASEEPAVVAKYAFRLAQSFNNFYHNYRILSEPDAARQQSLLYLVFLATESLARAIEILGIEVPERM